MGCFVIAKPAGTIDARVCNWGNSLQSLCALCDGWSSSETDVRCWTAPTQALFITRSVNDDTSFMQECAIKDFNELIRSIMTDVIFGLDHISGDTIKIAEYEK